MLAIGAIAWWLQWTPPKLPVASVDSKSAVDASTELEPATESAADETSRTANMATAPALFNTGFRGMPPVVLPRPVDSHLGAAEARALLTRTEDQQDCRLGREPDLYSRGDWERDTGTYWLENVERERVRAGRRAAIRRLLGACHRAGVNLAENADDESGRGEFFWARASAAASGDLAARLVLARLPGSQARRPDTATAALIQEALASGDAKDMGRMAELAWRRSVNLVLGYPETPAVNPRGWAAVPPPHNAMAMWLLVACDLGLDCGADSPTLDRLCLRYGYCGYPSVEEALRDGLIADAEGAETENRRRWIVAKVRSGQIHEIFKTEAREAATAQPPAPHGG
ncbi:MAG: hypothetical protein AB7E72_17900 [Lysobacterales bacterium]